MENQNQQQEKRAKNNRKKSYKKPKKHWTSCIVRFFERSFLGGKRLFSSLAEMQIQRFQHPRYETLVLCHMT